MSAGECTLGWCDRPHVARGLCRAHYDQQRHGRPMRGPLVRFATPAEAFAALTVPEVGGDCLLWLGTDPARFRAGGRQYNARKYAWDREFPSTPCPPRIGPGEFCDPQCCKATHLRPEWAARRAVRDSETMARGVVRNGRGFRAYVNQGRQQITVGTYRTIPEARDAARSARKEMGDAWMRDLTELTEELTA